MKSVVKMAAIGAAAGIVLGTAVMVFIRNTIPFALEQFPNLGVPFVCLGGIAGVVLGAIGGFLVRFTRRGHES